MSSLKFETLMLHAGQEIDPATQSRAVPIYQTTAYQFKNSEHGANLFALKEFGNIYTRIMNPTNDVFEKRIAALEGGVAALATASGHSAQFLAINNVTTVGDNFVTSSSLYGGTYNQFKNSFKGIGVEARFANISDTASFEQHIDAKTKLIYVETIGNPGLQIPDFEKLVVLAKKYLSITHLVLVGLYANR
jgi:O-acetylhomoserine/O-acetylserine sulfhydrylase